MHARIRVTTFRTPRGHRGESRTLKILALILWLAGVSAMSACRTSPKSTAPGTHGSGASGRNGSARGVVTHGYCTESCQTPKDCCPMGGPKCPSTYPTNYQCRNGGCIAPECTSSKDCLLDQPLARALANTDQNLNLECVGVAGVHACSFVCKVDDDCLNPLKCLGTDDDGKRICLTKPIGCTNDEGCGGIGKCLDGACGCDQDADCPKRGFPKCMR